MLRWLFAGVVLAVTVPVWAQQGSNPSGVPAKSSPANSSSSSSSQSAPDGTQSGSTPTPANSSQVPSGSAPMERRAPNLAPPRSDSVNADALGDEPGESSSKDTQIDLSPPPDDAKAHPQSSEILMDAETAGGNDDVSEFHPWDPHKAAKDVEVGDFYFKRKNYRAAEDRYREALLYKNNDAMATFRLAVCLEKLDLPDDARKEYESYLRILPHGPQAEEAQKAIDRMKGPAASAKPAK
jgi:tetratricopeptide (TPR) repeat protein